LPITLDRIDELGINCTIWTGRVTRDQALAYPLQIDPAAPETGCDWINYFHPDADLSDLDATTLLELLEVLRPVVAALRDKGDLRVTLVSGSRYLDPLLSVWKTIAETDADYAAKPVFVKSVAAAVRQLGRTEEEAARAQAWMTLRLAAIEAAG